MPESYRDLWNAVLSSVSGRDGRLIAISVRGAGPMFSEMHDRRADPAVVWHEFAAADDCPLDDEASWNGFQSGLGVDQVPSIHAGHVAAGAGVSGRSAGFPWA